MGDQGLAPLFDGVLGVKQRLALGVGEFLTAGLDGEIFLGKGDFRFPRVSILGDQVAGKTGKVEIGHFAGAPFAEADHFAGAGKMMGGIITGLGAGGYGAGDSFFEPPRHWL